MSKPTEPEAVAPSARLPPGRAERHRHRLARALVVAVADGRQGERRGARRVRPADEVHPTARVAQVAAPEPAHAGEPVIRPVPRNTPHHHRHVEPLAGDERAAQRQRQHLGAPGLGDGARRARERHRGRVAVGDRHRARRARRVALAGRGHRHRHRSARLVGAVGLGRHRQGRRGLAGEYRHRLRALVARGHEVARGRIRDLERHREVARRRHRVGGHGERRRGALGHRRAGRDPDVRRARRAVAHRDGEAVARRVRLGTVPDVGAEVRVLEAVRARAVRAERHGEGLGAALAQAVVDRLEHERRGPRARALEAKPRGRGVLARERDAGVEGRAGGKREAPVGGGHPPCRRPRAARRPPRPRRLGDAARATHPPRARASGSP